ncbi:MAG: ferredoxin [Comamonadaceae bacterium]|nr:MAG: ferredoxin [Comamonadaceae bacterium]
MLRITIDRAKCIAAGQCVLKSPEVFDQDEQDGIVILLNANPPDSLKESVKLAARVCPSEAIVVHED